MKTTDAHGKTIEQAVSSAMAAAKLHGKAATVGRLYVSPRRWIWGERFDAASATLEDGTRWDAVQVVEPEAA